ncbi:MAG: galactitol-1-phosphate 5-dehydrogenase [Ruminococcaceae bacterium]|nr:galactitol-1-phosphate 5-dehydrogenase [Oscillospiraceae bacterium]
MKAGILYKNEDIRYDDMPMPEPKAGEILVKVKMTGICGSDIPRVLKNGAHYYPIVLGHEFSGVVEKLGENVSEFAIGDRVSGIPLVPCMKCDDCLKGNYSLCKNYTFIGSRVQGSMAEYVVLPVQNAVRFDECVTFEQGAFFEPATVALHGIKCAGYTGGKRVAILGGGTIGLFTMQWAKIFGAKTVTVFDISDARLQLAKELGADHTVNTRENGFGKEKFDFVFETAGQVATIKAAFEIAANKASVCCIGTPHEELTFTPREWENMNRKEFKLTGSWMSYSSPFPGEEWILTAHCFKTGQLKFDNRLIFKKYPLSQIADAFELFKNPAAVGGKVLICNE